MIPKKLKALVLEDSESDALVAIGNLSLAGFAPDFKRVETEKELENALKNDTWEVILADYNLPDYCALDALKLVQRLKLDIPFIVISGAIGDETAVSAMKAGAHDYLMKGNLARLAPVVSREIKEAKARARQRKNESIARETEMRYRLLWESSPDAVVLLNAEGVICLVNPAMKKVFGYEPRELMGWRLQQLQPGDLSPLQNPTLTCSLGPDRGKSFYSRPYETLGLRKDGAQIHIEIAFGEYQMNEVYWFVAFIRDISQRKLAEEQLREQKKKLEVAGEIQERLFPDKAPDLPGYDLAGRSLPADSTGGDYYDYLPMVNGDLGIVIGDVTGHGLGAALLMAETRAYLRILTHNRVDSGDILTRANRVISEDVGFGMHVTMTFLRLELESRRLHYNNAGHPDGFIISRDGEIQKRISSQAMPLGIYSKSEYVSSDQTILHPGDLVVILTDGFLEAENKNGEDFGESNVLKVIQENRDLTAAEIVQALFDATKAFIEGAPLKDDWTLVILKVL